MSAPDSPAFDWARRLIPGSFRGVPFLIEGSQRLDTGRRGKPKEYSKRDGGEWRDKGRQMRKLEVVALVIGGDYLEQKDRLQRALERGEGQLHHPYEGRIRCVPQNVSITHTPARGGVATFRITFLEVGGRTFPTRRRATTTLVDDAATALGTAAEESMAADFSLAGQPTAYEDEAVSWVDDLTALWTEGAALAEAKAQELADFSAEVADLANQARAAVRDPVGFAATITGLGGAYTILNSNAAVMKTALKRMTEFTAEVRSTLGLDVGGQKHQAAARALTNHVRLSHVAGLGRTFARLDLESVQQATELAAEFQALVETQIELVAEAEDDALFRALVDLDAQIGLDLAARGDTLPVVFEFENPTTQPALVIAQDVYGDASRDLEIVDRNAAVRHPAFVPGGAVLELLTDAPEPA